MTDIQKIFADNLRKYRKAKKMSQEDLAKAAEIAVNSIRSYEQGKSNATLENIGRLANILGVTIGQLCDDNPEPQSFRIETYADLLSILSQLDDLCLDSGSFCNGKPSSSSEVRIECIEDVYETADFGYVETYGIRIEFVDKTLHDFFSTYNKMQNMVNSEQDSDGKATLISMKNAWVENQLRLKKYDYVVDPF